ncbi:MAG: hypothetical protein FJW40_14810 [Acidobacteria bacterium]|nr:hypothetical protein [Acidobacteriota bacterium]
MWVIFPEGATVAQSGNRRVDLGRRRQWRFTNVAGGSPDLWRGHRPAGIPILIPSRGEVTVHPRASVIEVAPPLAAQPLEGGSVGLSYLAIASSPNLVPANGFQPVLPDRGFHGVLTLRTEGSLAEQIESLARMVTWNGDRLDTEGLRRLLAAGEPTLSRRRSFGYRCRPLR